MMITYGAGYTPRQLATINKYYLGVGRPPLPLGQQPSVSRDIPDTSGSKTVSLDSKEMSRTTLSNYTTTLNRLITLASDPKQIYNLIDAYENDYLTRMKGIGPSSKLTAREILGEVYQRRSSTTFFPDTLKKDQRDRFHERLNELKRLLLD
jgi:hypothetical protein